MNNAYFEFWEIVILPIYLAVIMGAAYFMAPKSERSLFMWALSIRMIGALFFASIYIFYYGGGDTTAYYLTAKPFVSLFLERPVEAISALISPFSQENYSLFDQGTGYPLKYIYADNQTFTVSRVIAPILLISANRYIPATIVLCFLSFVGPWKLYQVFKDAFSEKRIAAISALFIPSVLFWGAGISKDTVTFTSAAYLIYGFYFTVIKREINIGRVIGSIIALYLILAVKPYIFIALLPGIFLWLLSAPISKVKNDFVRRFTIPFIAVVSSLLFVFVFQQFNDILGDYAADQILEKALITQEDLKRDFYGGNSFDIGTVDPSFTGVLAKFPIATFYGLYGPTILQVQNIVMFFSAIENTVLLFLTLRLLIGFRFKRLAMIMLDSPILSFSIVFALLFAFSIGFTTPNFGAMVRFKIPLLPFFVFFLLIAHKMMTKPGTIEMNA